MSTVPVVSVVVPAFNAERWIEQTIASAQGQTLTEIEIIIVVDGATDRTFEISQALAAQDPRINVLNIKNGGVARARNAGITLARGEFVAPLDADDLWHPQRLEHHVAALRKKGDDYAVAYSPYVSIDTDDMASRVSRLHESDGYTFGAHLCANFVGNGSALTIRTSALRAVGGYSPTLRDQGGEGCEDYLVQLRLAYRHKFVSVPEPLIGYRTFPGNMSSNQLKMRLSRVFMLDDIEAFAGEFPPAMFYHPRAEAILSLAVRHLREKHGRMALSVWWRELLRNPLILAYTPFAIASRMRDELSKLWQRLFPRQRKVGTPFSTWNPGAATAAPYPLITRIFMSLFSRYEANLRGRNQVGTNRVWATRTRGDDA